MVTGIAQPSGEINGFQILSNREPYDSEYANNVGISKMHFVTAVVVRLASSQTLFLQGKNYLKRTA